MIKKIIQNGIGVILSAIILFSPAQATSWQYYLDTKGKNINELDINHDFNKNPLLNKDSYYQLKKTVTLRSQAVNIPEYRQPLMAELSLIANGSSSGQVIIKMLGNNPIKSADFQAKISIEGIDFIANYQSNIDHQIQLNNIQPKGTNYQKIDAFDWLMLFAQAKKPMYFYLPLESGQVVRFEFISSEPLNGDFLVGSYLNGEKMSNFLLKLNDKH